MAIIDNFPPEFRRQTMSAALIICIFILLTMFVKIAGIIMLIVFGGLGIILAYYEFFKNKKK